MDCNTYPDTCTGDFGSTGYYDFQYTFTETGVYQLGFGVVNVGPTDGDALDPGAFQSDSALLLEETPEPSTLLLIAPAIVGAFLMRRRKSLSSPTPSL